VRPASTQRLFEPAPGADGNLVLEFHLVESALLESIERNSLDPYTCLVRDDATGAALECLDVASVTTLAGTINSTYAVVAADDVPTAVALAGLGANTTTDQYWGNAARCADGKLIGDGVLDSLDLYVMLAYYFGAPPYDALPAMPAHVLTVQGETDVGARCASGLTRTQYLTLYDPNDPCARPDATRRRLAASSSFDVAVHRQRVLLTGGAWYALRLRRLLLSVELHLVGVDDNADYVVLSNLRAPWHEGLDAAPLDPERYEVRFARHLEYAGAAADACATVVPTITGSAAMYYDVLALAQLPTDATAYCAFDVFLYVPPPAGGGARRRLADECGVTVSAASRGMDGIGGVKQRVDAVCDPAPYDFAVAAAPPPPAPPPRKGDDDKDTRVLLLVALGAVLGGALCLLGTWLCYARQAEVARPRYRVEPTRCASTRCAPTSAPGPAPRPTSAPPRGLLAERMRRV
jgi:hypothetical protein